MGGSKLQIEISKHCVDEKKYVINWLFGEVFGLEVDLKPCPEEGLFKIAIAGSKLQIQMPDTFFRLADQHWLQQASLPSKQLSDVQIPIELRGKLLGESVVVFLDADDQWRPRQSDKVSVTSDGALCEIPFDLFGSLFFLLSRYEEAICTERDKHDRFPSTASLTAGGDLLERAIGNEYIELLWNCLAKLWPGLKRKNRQFRTLPSHDIDHPSYFWNKTNATVLKKCVGDIVRRGNVSQSINRIVNWRRCSTGKEFHDPYDYCDWLMDQSEKNNLVSAFYYIPVKTHTNDPGMPIDHERVIDQWKRIQLRGHEIGYHPGYETYKSEDAIKKGAQAIRGQMDNLNLDCELLGGRQHVLRWETPTTARYLAAAGMSYDSTLGYAERPGFRCGVCYEYPMYDLHSRQRLDIRQRPLVAMDVTVINERYMNLSGADAFDCFVRIKRECEKFNGDFTLLWHNTELLTPQTRDLYSSILAA